MLYIKEGTLTPIPTSGKINWAHIKRKSDEQGFSIYPLPGNGYIVSDQYEVIQVGRIAHGGQTYKHYLDYSAEGMFEMVTSEQKRKSLAYMKKQGYHMPCDNDEGNWEFHFGKN